MCDHRKEISGDQGKPGKPGHRSIGRGSCRSARADGVERRVNSSGTRLTLTLGGGLEGPPRPVITPYPFPSRP